jgi:SAM-dependent methyltransferase
MKKNTSWGEVAKWYDDLLKDEDSFQSKVIEPNLLRLMSIKKGERILDLGCGQGYFSQKFALAGASVCGVDISKELIYLAEKQKNKLPISYFVASAEDFLGKKLGLFDKAAVVLALQNIKNADLAIANLSGSVNTGGKIYLVLNHPAFRIPGKSSWGFEETRKLQFRRLDGYLSEFSKQIDMKPGGKGKKEMTVSFHRPLQWYFKSFAKHGLAVLRLEEWVSHKVSDSGYRAEAENAARKEFPLFVCLELVKL